jgi:hypothetical protein
VSDISPDIDNFEYAEFGENVLRISIYFYITLNYDKIVVVFSTFHDMPNYSEENALCK